MTAKAFATNDIESHGHILLIPVALAIPVIMGAIGRVDLFQRYLMFYVTMLAIGTVFAIAFFLFESKTEQKVLTMDEDSVSFHDFGRHTLAWREIYSITIEAVETTKMKGGVPLKVERVVIRARRADAKDQGTERFALQFNYGMSVTQLHAVLKENWEAATVQRRGARQDALYRPNGAGGGFGRRRNDFNKAVG